MIKFGKKSFYKKNDTIETSNARLLNNMKQIAIIGSVGVPANYGGFETLAENLVDYLGTKHKLVIYCSSRAFEEKKAEYNGAKLKYLPFKANGVQSIIYDIISILDAVRYADTILILGVSGCIILPFIKFLSKKRLIVNIDGLEWKRDKWNIVARKYLKFSEKIAVQYADTIIGDNPAITSYIKQEYAKKSVMIPYGGDHAKKQPLTDSALERFPFLREKYDYALCRIEPENKVHIILEAYARENGRRKICFIGNWDSSDYGRKLKKRYSAYANIIIFDPIYDLTSLNDIRGNADWYLHGHSAGGTNPSLVEAMNIGLPIIAYDVSYNRETTFGKALYFRDVDELGDRLSNLADAEKNQISHEMLKTAEKYYTWEIIAREYEKLF